MGRGIGPFADSIDAVGGNGIGNVPGVQGVPVHQLAGIIRRSSCSHGGISVGLGGIRIDSQYFPKDFNICILSSQSIPVQPRSYCGSRIISGTDVKEINRFLLIICFLIAFRTGSCSVLSLTGYKNIL